MKVTTWNCNGALRRKLKEAESLEADILIVQECEDPARSTPAYQRWAGDYLWIGESKNRGIGVFARNGHHIEKLDWSGQFTMQGLNSINPSLSWQTNELRSFLPFVIAGDILVLAVWTKGHTDHVFGYMGQFWKFLQIHRKDLSKPKTLILGDFNSNSIWDKSDRWWNHSDVVTELESIGISSVYHHISGEQQGLETRPTFYLHRNLERPYHIDYIFASKDLLYKCALELPKHGDWLTVSDHLPLTVNFEH